MKYAHTVGDIEVERWTAVVLYDPRSGTIQHVHQCITLKGGKPPLRTEIERNARHGLRQSSDGRPVPRRLLALHVDPRTLEAGQGYSVDPRRRVLVKASRRRATQRTLLTSGKSSESARGRSPVGGRG